MRMQVLASALLAALACGRSHGASGDAPAAATAELSRLRPRDRPSTAASTPVSRASGRCPKPPPPWRSSCSQACGRCSRSPTRGTTLAKRCSGRSRTGPSARCTSSADKTASDDIEGAAWTDGHLYTLTSSGAVRRYAPSDPPGGPHARPRRISARSAAADVPAASRRQLRQQLRGALPPGESGREQVRRLRGEQVAQRFAVLASAFVHDALVIDASRPPIQPSSTSPARALSDCAFGGAGGPAEDVLVVTTNIYGGSRTYLVDEATGALSRVDVVGLPSNEGVAIDHQGALYQFMDGDTDVSVSPAYRTVCRGWPTTDRLARQRGG